MQGVLPSNVNSSIDERLVQGNDVHGLPNHREGILKTIKYESLSDDTFFLTVIGINNRENKSQPTITFAENILTIEQNGKRRKLNLIQEQKNERKSRLKLLQIMATP